MLWLNGQATLPLLLAWLLVTKAPCSLGLWLEGKHQTESAAAAMFGYRPLVSQPLEVGPGDGTSCELYGIERDSR